MKRFFVILLWTSFVFCAYSQQENMDYVEHLAPVSKSFDVLRPRILHSALSLSSKSEAAENKQLYQLKKAPVLMRDGVDLGVTDTMLLSKMTHKENGIIKSTVEITYDEYGLRKTYVEKAPDGSIILEYKYNYVVGDFNYWISREIYARSPQTGINEWTFVSYVERDIDSQKRLKAVREYMQKNSSNGAAERVLESAVVYDYEHSKDGVEIYNARYDDSGELIYELEYKWFEPKNDYILVRHFSESRIREEITIDETSIHTKSYYMIGMTEEGPFWYLGHEEYEYYGDNIGHMKIDYDQYGNIIYLDGSYYSLKYESNGCVIKTYYTYNPAAGWELVGQREIFENCFNEETHSISLRFGVNAKYTVESYDESADVWNVDYSDVSEWIYGNILKTTSLVGESTSVSYGKYADNGGYIIYIADVRFFEDGSFVTSNEPVDCPDELDEGYRTEATTFYDSKGNEAKRIIVIYYDAPSSLGQMWPSAKLYGWNGTAWERISSFDWYSKASENLRYNYSYNSEGYIESSEFYQYYDDRYVLVSDTRTSYSDNGYTNEYWSLKGEIGMPGAELSKVKSEEYSLLENDTVCFTVYNYSDDNVVSCVRTKSKDEIYWYYMFDGNSFVLYNIQYLPIFTTYENGIETTIERYIDSNWNIVNTTKSVYGVIDHGMSFYSIITPEYLNDNDLPGTDIYKTNMVSEINETYEWDIDKNDWVAKYIDSFVWSVNDGNISLSYRVMDSNGLYYDAETNFVLDNKNRVMNYVQALKYSEDGEAVVSEHDATYNEYGLLDTHIIKTSKTDEYNYEYSKFSINANGIDEVTPEMAVKIDGKLISCNNNDLLELYNVDGTKVASGRGCVAAPTSGIYILNVSGKALKIAIK